MKKKKKKVSLSTILIGMAVMPFALKIMENLLDSKKKDKQIEALERDKDWLKEELHKETEPK